MKSILVAFLCLTALPAIALDDKYKPSTKQDPIHNAQTKAAAAEAAKRKADAAKKADEPLLKKDVGAGTSVQTGTVSGGPGVVIKKETK
jgi:hypothetical protein